MPRKPVGNIQNEDQSFLGLFRWEITLVIFPVLYGFGAAFWWVCTLLNTPLASFYVGAGLCFTVAFVWSMVALYTHDSLKKPRVRYPTNRSAPSGKLSRRRRRRRNKRARKITAALSVLLYGGLMYGLGSAFYKFVHPPTPDNFEVFVRSLYKTRALRVPPRDDPRSTSGMTFALANIPLIDVEVGEHDTVTRLVVLVRNIGRHGESNLHIRIDTDGKIISAAPNIAQISPTELEVRLPNLPLYDGQNGEIALPIDMELPGYRGNSGLLITVENEDGQRYAATVKVQMARQNQ